MVAAAPAYTNTMLSVAVTTFRGPNNLRFLDDLQESSILEAYVGLWNGLFAGSEVPIPEY